VREPIRKPPRFIKQRLEQMAPVLVCLTGKGDGTYVINPRLEVGLLGLVVIAF